MPTGFYTGWEYDSETDLLKARKTEQKFSISWLSPSVQI